jgi:hypothetical protein
MKILVTWEQGGKWYPIEDVKPPYKAIRFIYGAADVIWDCLLRKFR